MIFAWTGQEFYIIYKADENDIGNVPEGTVLYTNKIEHCLTLPNYVRGRQYI